MTRITRTEKLNNNWRAWVLIDDINTIIIENKDGTVPTEEQAEEAYQKYINQMNDGIADEE